MVLRAPTGSGPQQYVVLPGRVVPVSDFTATLLLTSPAATVLGQDNAPLDVAAQTFTPAPAEESIDRAYDWPEADADQVNGEARTTICSVLLDVDGDSGATRLATWAGTGHPATIASGAATAYVTPGSGLLYRQVQGEQAESGSVFLVTDTGLRYGVQTGGDDPAGDSAQTRLGYGEVAPVPVPAAWSAFLPLGPQLDVDAAAQPQGS
jgi:hypothetical protein